MASLNEGIGVGSSLFTLVHIYCYENGFTHFSCHSEEVDESGRKLREWYKAMEWTSLRPRPRRVIYSGSS